MKRHRRTRNWIRRFAGSEYLDNVRTGATADSIRVKFVGDEVAVHLLMNGAAATEILTADGPGGSVLDRIPMVMATRRGASARFAAVLEPGCREAITNSLKHCV